MRLVIFIEPQFGASYADQLRLARHAEQLGFDGFFRSDHYLTMEDRLATGGPGGLPGPTDSWVTLGALAVQTSTIRLGTLVTSATFRLPGVLAMSVAQVDQMSAGRVELGLGAGWFEAEHTAYGIPFPAVGERFDRLEEQLSIVTGMWSTPVGERFDFVGRHYRLTDSPALPKPTQTPGVPIIIGGRGPRRTPALAARFGDEFNVPFRSVRETAEVYQRVSAACAVPGARAQGRAPLVLSAAQTVACGRTSEQAKARCATIGQTPLLSGTPDQVVDAIGQFAQAGTQRMFLQVLDITDLDHLDVLASHVLPQVR